MKFRAKRQVTLSFGKVESTLVENISGAAALGHHLWTVSDEGRTLERLARNGKGYELVEQVRLDDLLTGIPGSDAELDLEAVDVRGGRLWICGSHCRVRTKSAKPGTLNAVIRDRPSRHVLACFDIDRRSGGLSGGRALPFEERGSLRWALAKEPFLKPFMELPSKENGLDIEGLAAVTGGVLLGLRGPVVDSFAVAARVEIDGKFKIGDVGLHFLSLGGLGIRDLMRFGPLMLVLAGPVSDAEGPFRLFAWKPSNGRKIQQPEPICDWPVGGEKPEGLCPLEIAGKAGVLVVYDKPAKHRLEKGRYLADWMQLDL